MRRLYQAITSALRILTRYRGIADAREKRLAVEAARRQRAMRQSARTAEREQLFARVPAGDGDVVGLAGRRGVDRAAIERAFVRAMAEGRPAVVRGAELGLGGLARLNRGGIGIPVAPEKRSGDLERSGGSLEVPSALGGAVPGAALHAVGTCAVCDRERVRRVPDVGGAIGQSAGAGVEAPAAGVAGAAAVGMGKVRRMPPEMIGRAVAAACWPETVAPDARRVVAYKNRRRGEGVA